MTEWKKNKIWKKKMKKKLKREIEKEGEREKGRKEEKKNEEVQSVPVFFWKSTHLYIKNSLSVSK